MEVTTNTQVNERELWGGGAKPFSALWKDNDVVFHCFRCIDFYWILVSYGFSRFKNINSWPIADEVFTHFPFLHGIDAPMYYVALMTFILIFSSVTMVLAVDAGHT